MYQLASPYLRMGDSLRTDIQIAPGTTLSTCVIRESRSFHQTERATFEFLIPHFKAVLARPESLRGPGHTFRTFPLESLPRSEKALTRMVRGWIETLVPAPAPDLGDFSERCGKWLQRQRFSQSDPGKPSIPHTFNATIGRTACSLHLIGTTFDLPGAVVIRSHTPVLDELDPLDSLRLTPREREVCHWLCEGKTNTEIAVILSIKPGTVKRHLENIYGKLGVSNRASALRTVLEVLNRGTHPMHISDKIEPFHGSAEYCS